MEALQIFNYNNNPVSFRDENGQVYINATEMAKSFGKTPKDWLRTQQTQEFTTTLSAIRHICLTDLVKVSRGGDAPGTWMHEDVALEFSRWLSPEFAIWCNDRIKELMRTGITASDNMINQMLEDPDMMIGILTKLKEEREENRKQAELISKQDDIIDRQSFDLQYQAPKVAFADAIAISQNSCLVGELAVKLQQNKIKIGQNRLFAWLRAYGYLCVTGERYNLPTQKAMNLELFEVKTTTRTKPNGAVFVTNTPMVTGKGQIYIINKFLSGEADKLPKKYQ